MKLETLLVTTPETEEEIFGPLVGEREIEVVARLAPSDSLVEGLVRYAPALLVAELFGPEEILLERLECIPDEVGPAVILLAASERVARRAFDVGVTDFVLLPAEPDRLRLALRRACTRIRLQRLAAAWEATDGESGAAARQGPNHPGHDRLVGGSGGHLFFLAPEDICWIEADRNYVECHLGETVHRIRATLGQVESRLESHSFLRIHRSAIVNLEHVRELHRRQAGQWEILLDNGAVLRMSPRHLRRLLEGVGENGLDSHV